MAYADWKIHGDDTLAAYLPESTFKGILEKRVGIPPDLAAILIRDGRIVDVYHGAHLSVGGIWQRMKELIGGPHSIRLLVADLKPFPLRAGLVGHTKDHVEVRAEIAFEFQLDPENSVNLLGLVENDRSLTRADVYRRMRPHLQERVFLHELVQHDAEHLRANRGLQDRIQADVMKETERIAGRLGLMVNAVSVNWARTAEEVQAVKMRDVEREEKWTEFEFTRAKRELERAAETTVFRIRTDLDIEKVKAASEAELEQLLIENRFALDDSRTSGEQLSERKALAHGLEMAKVERLAEYDARLGDEENELERKRLELGRKKLELDFETATQQQALEIRRLENVIQQEKLAGLQEVELARMRAEHDLSKDRFQVEHGAKMGEKELDSQTELEKLRLQGAMSPDQILAIQAGLSPEVAKIFSERAGATADREALLREMLELSKTTKADSEAQAKAMFDKAVDNLAKVGVAAATGKKPAGSDDPGSGGDAAPDDDGPKVECPSCHFRVPATDRFCRNCAAKLRN